MKRNRTSDSSFTQQPFLSQKKMFSSLVSERNSSQDAAEPSKMNHSIKKTSANSNSSEAKRKDVLHQDLQERAEALRQVDDDEFFWDAMSDVVPLPSDTKDRRVSLEERKNLLRPIDEEKVVVRYLADLVEGRIPFDLVDSDEFTEGSVKGLDPRVMKKLKSGGMAWQAYLDLHGLRVEEARVEINAFIREQRMKGRRCLLVVHGRGKHSFDQKPVLKERLIQWMTQGFLHKDILAFVTARPHDGGAGAMYLLLRKNA
jgi:DNA-nicking Smr family endonuclease